MVLTQLQKGTIIEREHTKNRLASRKISSEHIKENNNYYKLASINGPNQLISVNRLKRLLSNSK